jgi:hypothetical protein
VTEERPQLRPGGGISRRFTGLLVGAAIGGLGLGSAPAAAGGSGPERPPVSAPARLAPEPAPVATRAPAPVTSVVVTRSASPQAGAMGVRPARGESSARPAQPRPARARVTRSKPPPPAVEHQVIKRVKSLTLAVERPAIRLAFVMPQTRSSDSNRLLFIGGLALLVLVLGDASLLALSARILRDPAER